MAKIFEFRPGSFIDPVSGLAGINVNGLFERTEKGNAYRCNGSEYLRYQHLSAAQEGSLSFVSWFKRSETGLGDRSPFGSYNSSAQVFRIRDGEWSYYLVDNNSNIRTDVLGTLNDTDWHFAILTMDVSGVTTGYLDGIKGDELTTLTTEGIDLTDFRIGLGAGSDYFYGDVGLCQIYDHVLTAEERAKLYQEFLRASPTSKIVEDNVVLSKPTDLSNVNGLVAAYNMIPNGDTLVDISGNGNNGNITPKGESGNGDGVVISTSEGLLCNGSGVIMLSSKNAVDVWSVAWRSKFKDTGAACYFIGRSYGSTVGNIGLSASEKIIFRENSGAYTIHSFTETIQYDKWYDFVMVSNGTQVALYISGVLDDIITPTDTGLEFEAIGAIKATIDSDIEFADYRQFNYAFTQEQAEQYHNSFQKLEKRGNFSLHPVGSTI